MGRIIGILGLLVALAGPVSAASAVLTWTDNATNEANFNIQRGTAATVAQCSTATFAPLITISANVVSFTDLTPVEGLTYCYRVRACNATGCSAYSIDSGSMCQRAPQLPKGGGFYMSQGDRTWDAS